LQIAVISVLAAPSISVPVALVVFPNWFATWLQFSPERSTGDCAPQFTA